MSAAPKLGAYMSIHEVAALTGWRPDVPDEEQVPGAMSPKAMKRRLLRANEMNVGKLLMASAGANRGWKVKVAILRELAPELFPTAGVKRSADAEIEMASMRREIRSLKARVRGLEDLSCQTSRRLEELLSAPTKVAAA